MSLNVQISGITVDVAQISDMVIELDVEGGPKSATVTLNCALDRAPTIGTDTLLVTYKTQVLFRGRLENITGQVDSSTGYTLTYAGPLVVLRDHKAYRTVFVDSDLDNWMTDQGATSDEAGIFTVSNDEGGVSISVTDPSMID